jgi:hypothetical protein
MIDAFKQSVSRMFRRHDKTPYEKYDEAREQMLIARSLMELTTSSAWPKIRDWLHLEANRFQAQVNELAAEPYANAEKIVHLNAQRAAREQLLNEIESSAARYQEYFERVQEIEDIIKAAEALKRANAM